MMQRTTKAKEEEKEDPEALDVVNVQNGTYKGYDWAVFYGERGIMRILTGYVRIPETHPAYEVGTRWSWSNLFRKSRKFEKETKGSKNPFKLPAMPKSMDRRIYRRKYEDIDLNVHGGLSFGDIITEKNMDSYFLHFMKTGFWVGWDYSHAGDEMYLPADRIIEKSEKIQEVYADIMAIHRQYPGLPSEKAWEFEEVELECMDAIDQLIALEKGYPECPTCHKKFNRDPESATLECWRCDFKREKKEEK